MDEWLRVLLPTLAGGVTGYVTRGEFLRLTERGRSESISGWLDMLAKMPEGAARDEVHRHVEGRVRYLLAYDQLPAIDDRLARQWDLVALLGGLLQSRCH